MPKKRDDRVVARLTRGSQPGRARVKGKRFSKEHQPRRARGRPKGAINVFTRDIKEAIIGAVNRYGQDGKGKDGLEGFVFRMCSQRPEKVLDLLRAIMPTQVTVERLERPEPYKSYAETCADLEREYGIKLDQPVYRLEYYKGPVVELDEDVTDNTDDAKDR